MRVRGQHYRRIMISGALMFIACSALLSQGQKEVGQHLYPLWPSEPVPGWPGVEADANMTRERIEKELNTDKSGTVFPATYGQPEFMAYPGAVHHERESLQRYVPPYPIFNHKTLVKNFILKDIPDYKEKCVAFAEPVYYNPIYAPRVPTSQTRFPVQCHPWKPGGEPVRFEIGRLNPSFYVVRTITAAPSVTKVEPEYEKRKYVFIKLRINDIPNAPDRFNTYILRGQTLDNFYATCEFFFHAEDDRTFRAELSLLPESQTDLLLHNVDLHDRFAELARRAGSRKSTITDICARKAEEAKKTDAPSKKSRTPEEQRAYDDEIWYRTYPPLNCYYETLWGFEKCPLETLACLAPEEWKDLPFLTLCKDGKIYVDKKMTFHAEPQADLAGVIDLHEQGKGKLFYNASKTGYDTKFQYETDQDKRDSAICLIRIAYDMPGRTKRFNLQTAIEVRGGLDRLDQGQYFHRNWFVDSMLEAYRKLFPFIYDNQELATAVGRYLPRVKTPEDVIALLDTHILQDHANEIMHYKYFIDHEVTSFVMGCVVAQEDVDITRPWMEFLWTRLWTYPQALSGLADDLVTCVTRDGGTTIGSYSYALVGQTATVQMLDEYIRKGGDRKYALADPDRYRGAFLHPYWIFEVAAAGRHPPGIGDVGGPTQPYDPGDAKGEQRHHIVAGWRWTGDPKFAWELVNTYGRSGENDEEWKRLVERAAEGREPYLQNKSRILSDWSGYLEGGQQEDDFRFRRAVAVRVGNGLGHGHYDTLDMRIWAHGIVMSGDAGQRPEYGVPRHLMSRVHNVMEVDGQDWHGYAWVGNLFDSPGCSYLRADSIAPFGMEHVTLFQRQVALVDVDEGKRSQKTPGRSDPSVVTPSSYIFDVFRGAGGKTHTYCFHGAVDDEFTVNIKNRKDMTGEKDDPDENYLRPFSYRTAVPNPDSNDVEWAGECAGDVLQATWRVARWLQHENNPEAKMYSGHKWGGAMTEPRKYMRLHLFDQGKNRVLHGICQDTVRWNEHNPGKTNYGVRCLFAQQRSENPADAVFVALIEPYAGEPFIVSRRLLSIECNETDARRAVAVEVKTANGRRDLLFADARPGKLRKVTEGRLEVAGEYAYLSEDDKGLRLVTLSNGRMLRSPEVTIEVDRAEYGGKVKKMNYLRRMVTVEGEVPAYLTGHFFEAGGDFHRTSYEVAVVQPEGKNSVLTLRKGLEIMRSRVRSIEPGSATVITAIAMPRFRGRDRELVASDDQMKKFWRVEYTGGDRFSGHVFKLSHLDPNSKGEVFTAKEFPPGGGVSIWEFGAGDRLVIKTGVSLRRIDEGVFETYATTPFTMTIPGGGIETKTDGGRWKPIECQIQGGMARCGIGADIIAASKCKFLLRVTR